MSKFAMTTNLSPETKSNAKRLVCANCGNTQRFFELMDVETHLVDGSLNYLHLVDGIVDHYVCCECGESLPTPAWAKPAELVGKRQNK